MKTVDLGKISNKVKNRVIGGSMLTMMALSGVAGTLVHADTSSDTGDKWGTAADDKTVQTTKGVDGKTINLTNEEHADYSQSTPFYAPLTFPNDEKLTSAGFTEDVVDGLVFDSLKVYKVDKTIQSESDLKDVDLSKAKDVTDQGTVDKHKNGEKWTFKNAQDAFGQSFVVEVKVHMSADGAADLTQYADKNGVIHIPNTINQFWNDHKKDTNTPDIIPPKTVDPSITKKIVDKDGKLVDKRNVDFDHDYSYVITNNAGSNTKLDKIVSTDDLENVIDLKTVKVVEGNSASGKDVSSQFDIRLDNAKESYSATAKKPKDWANKVWSVVVTGRLKNTTDLMDFLTKNGDIEVGNVAHLDVNGDDHKSNNVIVIPPTVKDQAKKFIEQTSSSKDKSDSTSDKSDSSKTGDSTKKNSGSSSSTSSSASSSTSSSSSASSKANK